MDYMNATRVRMEGDGSIKIYEDALAKIDAQGAEDQLPIDIPAQ